MNSNELKFLKNIREELRMWPYTIHQIDDTLDSSLIEGRAKQVLFQALNSGLLTAFVGSGVSAAYGRMSWGAWKTAQLKIVEDGAAKFVEAANKSLDLMTEWGTILDTAPPPPAHKASDWAEDCRLSQRWLKHRRQITSQALWEVKNIQKTFLAAQSKNGHFPGGEDLPIVFEIAKRLHDLLLRHCHLFLSPDDDLTAGAATHFGTRRAQREGAPMSELASVEASVAPDAKLKSAMDEFAIANEKYCSHARRPESQVSFDKLAKLLLIDECAHAEMLLREGLAHSGETDEVFEGLELDSASSLKRDVDGLRENPKRFKILLPFRIKYYRHFLKSASGATPADWQDILDKLLHRLENYDADGIPLETEREFLTPTSRFLVPMLWQLLNSPNAILGIKEKFETKPSREFSSRRNLVAKRFDPLSNTINKLNIRRYLTTNYDFEIERHFQDQGYRRFDTHNASPALSQNAPAASDSHSFRVDGLGGVLKDMTFSSDTAADLVGFATHAGSEDASVFHLHGRATLDDQIVATERDYMNRYLRYTPNRDTVDESILMAFAATPTLFLGLGMEEADLLRPLRQFISDRDRTIGYQSIVLLPADKDFDSRAKMSAGLYMRYGAHTIFFGGGEINITAAGQNPTPRPLDWLHRVLKLITALQEAIPKTGASNGKPMITLTELDSAIGELGPDLAVDDSHTQSGSALAVLLGQTQEDFSELRGMAGQDLLAKMTDVNVQDCHFTACRHRTQNEAQIDRRDRVNGATYTWFYTALLSDLLRLCLADLPADPDSRQRSLRALKTAFEGLKGALITASFNAALEAIEIEWRQWWRDWQLAPPHRESSFEQITAPSPGARELKADPHRAEVIFPRILIRHRVISVITDITRSSVTTAHPVTTPDHTAMSAYTDADARTGVRIFDTFIYDVASAAQIAPNETGRVFHTIAAARGQGKGVLFSIFTTRLGITSYLRAAHPETGIGSGSKAQPFLLASILINLSFSAEVGSVLEMVERALIECAALMKALRLKQITLAPWPFATRKTMLEILLKSAKRDTVEQPQWDWLDKVTKAVEVEEQALRDELRDVSRTEKLGFLIRLFSQESRRFATDNRLGLKLTPRLFICLNALELLFDAGKRFKNFELYDVLNFLTGDRARNLPLDLIVIGDLQKMGSVWTSDKVNRRVVLVRPELSFSKSQAIRKRAKAYNVDISNNLLPTHARHDLNLIHCARPVIPYEFLVDNFLPLAIALYLARNRQARLRKDAGLSSCLRKAFEDRQCDRKNAWHKGKIPSVNDTYRETNTKLETSIRKTFWKALHGNDDVTVDEVRAFILKDYQRDDFRNAAAQDWRDALQILGYNRFCLTILMAAAQHLIFAHKNIIEGGQSADSFLQNIVARVRNSSKANVEREVLETVMGVYSDTSKIGDVNHDHELHTHMLRNIAVLGCPVSPNVLVRLPDIREYFNRVKMNDKLSRRRMIAAALATLSERGLVFRLSPHPKLLRLHAKIKALNDEGTAWKQNADYKSLAKMEPSFEEWPAETEFRYALHRQMQSYCFERLGNLSAPPVTANGFAPSLYAAMPSRVVRLSKEGYLFLRRLLLGLSQYPDIRQEDAARDIPIFSNDDIVTRVQALRCAMSLARTSFSIAAVSRFSDDTTGLGFVRKRGYFETYRVRLRWLLRKAGEVHEPGLTPKDSPDLVNALYRDEIIWLYNEVAVTCLVQGALVEAIGHARQALYLNRKIEGVRSGGRMHNMMSLNLAIMQLERGRLTGAEQRLQAIMRTEQAKPHRVYWLAKGYLGLIAQLRGRQTEAKRDMKNTIIALRKTNEDRALAIVTHHYARLIARTKPEKAHRLLGRARDYAETGGHEDVRHRIMVSEVWVSQTFQPDSWKRVKSDRVKLREIEKYARMMGMSSLLVDCLHAQGMMLLNAGDHASSGRLMTHAMAIARRNDMNLRLNKIMTDYARVLIARRRMESAKRLLNAALAMAKRSGYSLEVVRIHQELEHAEELTVEER